MVSDEQFEALQNGPDIEVEITPDDEEEGGVVVDFGGGVDEEEAVEYDHDENLADKIDNNDLQKMASDLASLYEADKRSRADWEKTFEKGMDLLGLKIETRQQPWPGACGVTHPVLLEAIIRFQAQAIMEIFPAAGPCRTKIIGKIDRAREEQSKRVEQDMNYNLTEVMSEYRPETEKLLFGLPFSGAAFRKIYRDPTLDRAVSMYVPAEDFIVNTGASDLRTATRYTHVMRRSNNEIRKQQVAGFYSDVDLQQPAPKFTGVEEKKQKATGETPSIEADDRHILLEMCVDYDVIGYEDPDGIRLPYVITIEDSSQKILSIRRNWREEDPLRIRRTHFVAYCFIPGIGFYGFGLIHLIGGLTRASTSILRQLVDAGTLSNLPGGLKSRGLRIKGDDSPIHPGEWRDVDIPGGKIQDNILPLPYGEPSAVLHTLLLEMVEEARRFVSLTDLNLSSMNSEAPVGTTLALLERSMKVMNGIQARLHASMKDEFKLISEIIAEDGGEYHFEPASGTPASREQDYNPKQVSIIPVSDPNASSMAQRIMQHQAAHQLSTTAPQIYDQVELHRSMLDSLGMENIERLIPGAKDPMPEDPVTENMNLINLKPVKAHWHQDHASHITVHLNAIKDPKILEIVGQSPSAGAITAAAEAHIREHVAYEYRREIEKQLGVQLPPPGEPLPPEIENDLSSLAAAASNQLLEKDQMEARAAEIQRKLQDPVVVAQERDSRTKEKEVDRKGRADQWRHVEKVMEITTDKEIEETKIAKDVALAVMEKEAEDNKQTADNALRGAQVGVKAADILSKERIAKQAKPAKE
ncbi:MAG TPA: hypothetical protein VMX15_04420 [Candidatus Heimdallarchaeota archaeon]|nr:hypothetical protein [Candidatus Heimdallarchaeota archaeon]